MSERPVRPEAGAPGAAPALTATLTLPPDPRSPSAARGLLRDALRSAGRDDWLDRAELAVSELVTNAALHAHTELTVTVRLDVEGLYVEVRDHNPMLPVQRDYDAQATTGRGLALVCALASDCGVVSLGAGGKHVWFSISDSEAGAPEPSEQDLLDAWDDAQWDLPSAPDDTGTTAARTVRLLGMPPALWLAARQHHDALLRELVLYLAEHDDVHVDLPAADRARGTVYEAVLAALRAREQAGTGGPAPPGYGDGALPPAPAPLDLLVEVPVGIGPAYQALQDALDAAERLAVAGRLLVAPGLPEVVAVRDWACEQVVVQLADGPPVPWAGTAQGRFETAVHARGQEHDLVWDRGLVSDSPHGAVAADEANRIIAVSRPLAAALGWRVDDLVGRRVVTLVPPHLREGHVAGFSRHLSTGESRILGVEMTLPVLRADGSQVPCRFLLEQAPAGLGRTVYVAWIEPQSGEPAEPTHP